MNVEVARLIDGGRLERVPPDFAAAGRAIRAARRHLDSTAMLIDDDPDLAYTALYDAVRKSCAALLQAEGLRAISRGGHGAVQYAVLGMFGQTGPLRSFDRLRRRRNEVEYLHLEAHPDDVRADLPAARSIVEFAASRLPAA